MVPPLRYVNFFFNYMGFKKNNNKFVNNILNKTPSGNIAPNLEKRGRQVPHNKYQRTNLVNKQIAILFYSYNITL